MKIKRSQLDSNSPIITSKQPKNNRLIWLLFPILGSILASYFIWRTIQINTAQKLVDDCSLNNNCSQIISALETLIKAQKNTKLLDLSNANLSNANLSNADLYRTNLSSTDLSNTNFAKTNLYRTDLGNANLAEANLKNANLTYANLKSAKNLTPTQIKSACNWEKAYYKGRFDHEYSEWIIDKAANEQFIKQLQQDFDSTPKQPVDCSKWKNWTQDK